MDRHQLEAISARQQLIGIRLSDLVMRVQESDVSPKTMETFCQTYLDFLASCRESCNAHVELCAHDTKVAIALIRENRLEDAKKEIREISSELFKGMGIASKVKEKLDGC